MSIWQDQNGNLHDDMVGTALKLKSWPQNVVLLSDSQISSIKNPVISVAAAQASALAEYIAYADALTANITGQYPQAESASWPDQLAEAKLVQAGQTPLAPSLLQTIVTVANDPAVTLQTLATSIIAKAKTYQTIVATVQALRTSAQTQLSATTDASQIPAVLAALKAKADAAAKQLGI